MHGDTSGHQSTGLNAEKEETERIRDGEETESIVPVLSLLGRKNRHSLLLGQYEKWEMCFVRKTECTKLSLLQMEIKTSESY